MNRLKEVRVSLGLTQPEVSAKLKEVEPRVDVGVVSRYENGVSLPTATQLTVIEEVLKASRYALYTEDELDLLTHIYIGETAPEGEKQLARRKPETRYRKCYRVPRPIIEALPADLLTTCNYVSWNDWHAACLRRLLAEYAARKKYANKKAGEA